MKIAKQTQEEMLEAHRAAASDGLMFGAGFVRISDSGVEHIPFAKATKKMRKIFNHKIKKYDA